MILPNLLIVGAAKSGTTSLHNYLSQHPDVFMSKHKEPHFLINNEIGLSRIPKGINKINDYSNLFLNSENYKYRGESSAMYLQFPEIAIKNIKKYLDKHVKIIIMLRNPVDRAFSGYQHVKRYNTDENLDFPKAIDQCEDRYLKNIKMTPASRYINVGMYHDFVKKFINDFPNQTHIIIYDDFVNNTTEELDKVFDFLQIEKININTSKHYMVGGWQWKNQYFKNMFLNKNIFKYLIKIVVPFKSGRLFLIKLFKHIFTSSVEKMEKKTRQNLEDIYREDVKKLSHLLGRDLNFWIK
tara:strand:+ start:387 stop:1277 length:891 start_codon:yes stop_codon:yes gene_type:complete